MRCVWHTGLVFALMAGKVEYCSGCRKSGMSVRQSCSSSWLMVRWIETAGIVIACVGDSVLGVHVCA